MNKIAFVATDARASLGRILLTTLCAAFLGLAILIGSGCSDKKGDITYPQPPEPQALNWLFDVYGTGPDDVYACGNKGAMFHFDGSDWTYMDMGTTAPIVKVWENAGTFYAIGHGGRIWKNTSGQWSSMSSGTSQNLYGIGSFDGEVYACGAEGTLRRLSGNNWVGNPDSLVVLDPANVSVATDTLIRARDLSSLLTVNHYFIGGAYKKDNYDPDALGILGTDGMLLASPPPNNVQGRLLYPPERWWRLRPLRGDQLADAEWILCTTSSPAPLSLNYLGTSEGWLFQLEEDEEENLIWVKHYPSVTLDIGNGIRDMWIDEDENLYMVTDDGQLVFQSSNYDFDTNPEGRKVLFDQVNALVGIWGSGSDNIYMVGLVENFIYQASMDFSDTTLVGPTEIPVTFPSKGMGLGLFEDELGRPRF